MPEACPLNPDHIPSTGAGQGSTPTPRAPRPQKVRPGPDLQTGAAGGGPRGDAGDPKAELLDQPGPPPAAEKRPSCQYRDGTRQHGL
ncbi:MAG: hypothetical protein JXB85_11225 [Anaerolineales bacterium]|nr:hypothetical protein [Anaerolineales bacterium]